MSVTLSRPRYSTVPSPAPVLLSTEHDDTTMKMTSGFDIFPFSTGISWLSRWLRHYHLTQLKNRARAAYKPSLMEGQQINLKTREYGYNRLSRHDNKQWRLIKDAALNYKTG